MYTILLLTQAPPYQDFSYANRRIPSFKIFYAALMSLLWAAPHTGQVHFRTERSFAPDHWNTAGRAKLTGREESINRDHHFSVPCSFILQLPPNLAPTCILNRFCQLVIFDHVGRSHIFKQTQSDRSSVHDRQIVYEA